VKEAGKDYVVLQDTASQVEARVELSGGGSMQNQQALQPQAVTPQQALTQEKPQPAVMQQLLDQTQPQKTEPQPPPSRLRRKQRSGG
jgi:hypothetical protein